MEKKKSSKKQSGALGGVIALIAAIVAAVILQVYTPIKIIDWQSELTRTIVQGEMTRRTVMTTIIKV